MSELIDNDLITTGQDEFSEAVNQIGDRFQSLLEQMTGTRASQSSPRLPVGLNVLLASGGSAIGYSQFNEILVLLGYNRVKHSFFQYLVDGTPNYIPGSGITSIDHLVRSISRFRILAISQFGSVRYGFKKMSTNEDFLERTLEDLQPLSEDTLKARHKPVMTIEDISGPDAFYLGHIIQKDIKERLDENPNDVRAQAEESKRLRIVQIGKRNHRAYLISDHLDVYVATSMRERHEFVEVRRLTTEIFSHGALQGLNIRWFDPTQAFCDDRIDKGLAEALMLKRAKCTIYFAQENDTLGKDSELATTLAQGKTVIAYVPRINESHLDRIVEEHQVLYERDEHDTLLEQLRLFDPNAAWHEEGIRSWLSSPASVPLPQLRQRVLEKMTDHYDRRANLLKEIHPLGIQVNLTTGVANGVLIARTVDECAELVRRVMTKTLSFWIEEIRREELRYFLLREEITNSVYRVVTGDELLTNAFWNFYFIAADEYRY